LQLKGKSILLLQSLRNSPIQQTRRGVKVNLHKFCTPAPGRSKWSASQRQTTGGKQRKSPTLKPKNLFSEWQVLRKCTICNTTSKIWIFCHILAYYFVFLQQNVCMDVINFKIWQ
jgi:hypothetical protein